MYYSNPDLDHTVNVTNEPEVKTFGYLVVCVLLLLAAIFVAVYLSFRWITPFIPFRYESYLVNDIVGTYLNAGLTLEQIEAQSIIQSLAENLAKEMDLPPEYTINVLLTQQPEKNAFATLGGNIILTQGMLDSITSENALAMVLGHEIGHIKKRDPLISAGSGLLFSLLIGILDRGSYQLELQAAYLLQLNFSREQEREADHLALTTVQRYYGHLSGVEEFFEQILKEESEIDFFQTHPHTHKRLEKIYAAQMGKEGKTTPLPKEIKQIQSIK